MTNSSKKITFGDIEFVKGAHNFSQIPDNHFPEIAFIGASNVGKSSIINAIFGKKITIVSSTPGRTQQLNFFKVAGFRDGFYIVDLPGYGFAEASAKKISHWQNVTFEYLAKSQKLQKVFLLIDAVKGLKHNDIEVIEYFLENNILFQIILTKIDKINLTEQQIVKEKILQQLALFKTAQQNLILTSSSKKYGINEIKSEIIATLKNL